MTDPGHTATETESPRDQRKWRGLPRSIYALGGGLLLFALVMLVRDDILLRSGPPTPAAQDNGAIAFTPPPMSSIPNGPAGASIRHGMAIFENTGTEARAFVGNGLACRSCHLDAGRKADSAPMWAAWVSYPQYRAKNKKMNSMEDRLNGCFSYSMNGQDSPSGGPPPKGDPIYTDLEAYFHWLASNAPTGAKLKGAGFPKLKLSSLGYDRDRGRAVYAQHCASCHGDDGQGRRDLNGRQVFPPLWGANSYNWGAGMAQINNAAGFIKANMPLGAGNSLTDQQAWDAAAWIDSQERPKDPRQKGSVQDNAAAFHEGEKTFYGKTIDNHLLGTGTSPKPRL